MDRLVIRLVGQDDDLLKAAEKKMASGQKVEAQALLMNYVSKMPSRWKPVNETPKSITIAFWDLQEFLSYVDHFKKTHPRKNKKLIIWANETYSKAYYYLASIVLERKDLLGALRYIDEGLKLEPDHPLLLFKKAEIYRMLKRHKEALKLYKIAMNTRPWLAKLYKNKGVTDTG